jgi:type IV pilus assembly protein PilW
MKYQRKFLRAAGFGLLELMIAMTLGLIVTAGVLVIFLAQRQVYNSSSSQSLMQDADNAIAATITPIGRGIGFMGCGALNGNNNVAASLPTPTTTLTFATTSAVLGYTGTLPATVVDNAANVTTTSDWTPALDTSIVTAKGAEQGSDILVLLGAKPFTAPIGVTTAITTSSTSLTVNDATQLSSSAPQVIAVSDCGKSAVLEATAVAGTTVTLGSVPTIGFNLGAQLVPLQQTMFFVGYGTGGQSGLFEGVMTIPAGGTTGNAAWAVTEMVPGVLAMKVLYGIGGSEAATEYVDASAVSSWTNVTTIKLAFLVEGETGSSRMPSTSTENYTLFYGTGTNTVTVPSDTRMRHVFYMTINTRNATL